MAIKRLDSLICDTCDYQSSSHPNLNLHILHVHEKLPRVKHDRQYVCDTCLHSYRERVCIMLHLPVHQPPFARPDKRHRLCDDCDRQQRSTTNMFEHFLHVHSQRRPRLKCFHCDFRAKYQRAMAKHENRMHSNTPGDLMVCDGCDFVGNRSNFSRHNKKHRIRLSCPECDRKFATTACLRKHRLVWHSDEKNYECDQCRRKFKLRMMLRTHLKVCFGGQTDICDDCDHGFPAYLGLLRHISEKHFSEQKYKCNFCARRYASNGYLKRHIKRKHQALKEISVGPCPECGKSVQHMHRHRQQYHSANKTVYQCDLCTRKCGRAAHLVRHFRELHADFQDLIMEARTPVPHFLSSVVQRSPNNSA